MPIRKIQFRKDGGPLRVEIKFGNAQVGFYTLGIWESGKNEIIMREEGNNDNPDDDTYPMPDGDNDGRMIDCVATVIAPDHKPGDQYVVDLIVYQNNSQIDKVSDSGDISEGSTTRRLVAKLRAV